MIKGGWETEISSQFSFPASRTRGKFTSGNSGRPKRARNKKTLAIESLLERQAEALTQTAISKALDEDSMALRLCMERIAPAPKDHPVSFTLFLR